MNEKFKNRILFCLAISLLIHLGFLVWSFFVKIVSFDSSSENLQKVMRIKITHEDFAGEESKQVTDSTEKLVSLDNPFSQNPDLGLIPDSSDTRHDSLQSAVQNTKEVPVSTLPQPSQDIKQTKVIDTVSTQKVSRFIRKNLVEVGDLPQLDVTPGQPVLISGEDVSKDFLDKSNQSLRVSPAVPVQAAGGPNEFEIMKRGTAVNSKKKKTGDLGTTLVYELYKYEDPKSGQKYFKLVVKVRDATVNFPVIPKEVIFLLDSSQSIGEKRLDQFRQGVFYSVTHLNPDDRFNIIIFKDKTIPFSPASVAPSMESIKKAFTFLDELKVGSKTDMYNALRTSINLSNSLHPSYRVLLSDGVPTSGIVNSSQVINEISKGNDGRVSIFALSGGVGVSEYMLDFIAYKNRGWSQIVKREYFIAQELSKLYDRIKDPLLLNLRYRISGLNEGQVFPQVLPDFFKGSEFVVYGNYTAENKFFVQLLGDARGETKEFVLSGSLDEATSGDKEIARQWAFHKVYHLIGQLKYDETNELLLREINELCGLFDIVTPYSKNFRELPKSKPQAKPQDPPPPASSEKKG